MQHDRQPRDWMLLARCGIGLGSIVLIASIGAGSAGGDQEADRKSETRYPVKAAEQDRRDLFDQRRQRYGRETEGGRFAREQQLRSEAAAPVAGRNEPQ